jgi:hypothetical protein
VNSIVCLEIQFVFDDQVDRAAKVQIHAVGERACRSIADLEVSDT